MVWKSHSADELIERPQALVAIPIRRSKLALLILLPAFIGLFTVMTVIVFGNNQRHLKAVTIRAPRSPTARILVVQTPTLPPMTVDLCVPECYRAEVEKANRACGKWSE